VGRVCGENKHNNVIPCHRASKSDCTIGVFSAKAGIVIVKKIVRI
jgi:Methylated DNA-protein cysteine methyltransferase